MKSGGDGAPAFAHPALQRSSGNADVLASQSVVHRDGKITSHLGPVSVPVDPDSQLESDRTGGEAETPQTSFDGGRRAASGCKPLRAGTTVWQQALLNGSFPMTKIEAINGLLDAIEPLVKDSPSDVSVSLSNQHFHWKLDLETFRRPMGLPESRSRGYRVKAT